MQNRFRNWIAARRSDPVPTLLTIAGCVMSAAALLYALTSGWLGVVANIIADLILIGPALLISNIIVRRIQDARVRARVQPLLHVIAQLLHWAVPTAKQALDTLEIKADLDMPCPARSKSDWPTSKGRWPTLLPSSTPIMDHRRRCWRSASPCRSHASAQSEDLYNKPIRLIRCHGRSLQPTSQRIGRSAAALTSCTDMTDSYFADVTSG